MKPPVRRTLFWAPRILGILFALFVTLFALDVFGEGYSFWVTLWALLMHLIPTALVVVALAIAWRWEWVGAVLFIGLGVFYMVAFRGRAPWAAYLVISGPLFLVGALFLVNWRYREELRAES